MTPATIAESLKLFIRRTELDPGLAKYEHIVYKAALDGQGANLVRIIDAADRDAAIMRRASAIGKDPA